MNIETFRLKWPWGHFSDFFIVSKKNQKILMKNLNVRKPTFYHTSLSLQLVSQDEIYPIIEFIK